MNRWEKDPLTDIICISMKEVAVNLKDKTKNNLCKTLWNVVGIELSGNIALQFLTPMTSYSSQRLKKKKLGQ